MNNAFEARVKGWKRRGIYDDPRLTEISRLYEAIGFIVRLEPFRPVTEKACSDCIKANPDKYKVLYTKKIDCESKNRYQTFL